MFLRVSGLARLASYDQLVIPRSEKVGLKPLYVCLGYSIHMHSNNMIQMQCSIKHSNYSLHNDL
jgi:hypothetical protein